MSEPQYTAEYDPEDNTWSVMRGALCICTPHAYGLGGSEDFDGERAAKILVDYLNAWAT